jgi:hypothetical protein
MRLTKDFQMPDCRVCQIPMRPLVVWAISVAVPLDYELYELLRGKTIYLILVPIPRARPQLRTILTKINMSSPTDLEAHRTEDLTMGGGNDVSQSVPSWK